MADDEIDLEDRPDFVHLAAGAQVSKLQVSTQVPPCASHERSALCNINLFARSGVSAGNTRDVAYDLNKPDLHPAALGAEAGGQERQADSMKCF